MELHTIAVGMGEYKLAQAPAMLRTNLGSCVGVCLFDKNLKIGGLLHVMLPASEEHRSSPNFKKEKFADTGIDMMLEDMQKNYRVKTQDLVAKIFGGACVLEKVSRRIGDENAEAVKNKLKQMGVKVVAQKLGGKKGYQIDFDINSGAVYCRNFGCESETY